MEHVLPALDESKLALAYNSGADWYNSLSLLASTIPMIPQTTPTKT
ncbi:MAG TPA: hypothetical protein VK489_07975 [Ferruginibacter sp.]|nr:hypothetical protein [Ferruginibacter sp.]